MEKFLAITGNLTMLTGIMAGRDTVGLAGIMILCTALVINELRPKEAQ